MKINYKKQIEEYIIDTVGNIHEILTGDRPSEQSFKLNQLQEFLKTLSELK